ncbi:unnamed protein product [Hermetia illucens]|uniref:Retrovirus-related Pol polyprotein from transposon TNT 1-94-like beta-barrel domain-containing protein n=1 Tax=Hermetia illucens TaxID=343691 RepID=A0A7R8YSN5_HERIL|nr:unnamed protein product [Hermetia illucens]
MRSTLQETTHNKIIRGIYFDGRKDKVLVRIQKEEHYVILSESGSDYFGHVNMSRVLLKWFINGKTQPCHICGGTNHSAAQCRNRNRNTTTNYYIEVARLEEAKNVTSKTRWCLYSGCTTHMCSKEEMLTDIQECAATLNMANTPSTTAGAKGIAHINAAKNDDNVQLNLHNTLLVKDLRPNLISVSKITRDDQEILFRKDDAIIKDLNGEVKMIADRIGDLYYLREAGEQVKAATDD